MSTEQHSQPIGITAHVPTMRVTQLHEARTDATSHPFTVLDFGGFRMHITSADDARSLLTVLQNAIVKQEMAEAKARRDHQEVAQ